MYRSLSEDTEEKILQIIRDCELSKKERLALEVRKVLQEDIPEEILIEKATEIGKRVAKK